MKGRKRVGNQCKLDISYAVIEYGIPILLETNVVQPHLGAKLKSVKL